MPLWQRASAELVSPLIGGALGAVVYGFVAAPKATPGAAVARS